GRLCRPLCACRWSGIRRHKRNDSNAGSCRGFCPACLCRCQARQKEEKFGISSSEIAYTAKTGGSTSIVVASEVEGPREIILRFCNGIFRPRKLSGLKMTKNSPRRDLHSPVARRNR